MRWLVLALLFPALSPFSPLPGLRGQRLLAAGESLEQLQRRLEERPNDEALYLRIARIQYRQRAYQDAAITLEQLLTRRPESKKGRYRLALTLRKLQRYQEAVELYRALIREEPDAPNSYYGLGVSLEQSGDPTGAIEAFEEYIERENRPGEERWIQRAREQIERLRATRVLRPEQDEARQDGEEEREVSADLTVNDPKRARADQLFAAGDYQEALATYQELLRAHPEASELLYRAGTAAALAGERERALDYALRFLHRNPRSDAGRLLATLSYAQRPRPDALSVDTLRLALREGRFSDTLRLAEELEAANPGRARIAQIRGRALLALGRPAEAMESFEEALGRGATPELYLDLAEAALLSRRPRAAQGALQRLPEALPGALALRAQELRRRLSGAE